MREGSVQDVASAQAIVLLNFANGRQPDRELMEIAGVSGADFGTLASGADFGTLAAYRGAPYEPSGLARLFRPRMVEQKLAQERSYIFDALDEPMRHALAAAAANDTDSHVDTAHLGNTTGTNSALEVAHRLRTTAAGEPPSAADVSAAAARGLSAKAWVGIAVILLVAVAAAVMTAIFLPGWLVDPSQYVVPAGQPNAGAFDSVAASNALIAARAPTGVLAGAIIAAGAAATGLIVSDHNARLTRETNQLTRLRDEDTRRRDEDTRAHNTRLVEREQERADDDRFTTAIGQIGDTAASVRLGGLHALHRLAQQRPERRPTILDILSAYLRQPFHHPHHDAKSPDLDNPTWEPPPGHWQPKDTAARDERDAEAEVRRTALRLLTDLLPAANSSDPGPDINLQGAALVGNWNLFFKKVGEINLSAAYLGGHLQLDNVSILGSLMLEDGAGIGGSLELGEDASIAGNLMLGEGASIGHSLRAFSTSIAGSLVLGEGVSIGGDLHLEVGVSIGGSLVLRERASIGHNVWLGDRVHLGGFLQLGDHAQIGGSLQVGSGASVGGNLELADHAIICGSLDLWAGAHVDGGLELGNDATIGGHLALDRVASVSGGLGLGDRATIGGSLILREDAMITGGVRLGDGAEIGSVSAQSLIARTAELPDLVGPLLVPARAD